MAEQSFSGTPTPYELPPAPQNALPSAPQIEGVTSVRILSFTLKNDGGKPYASYQIEISTPQTRWQVEHRYREIDALHEWAVKNFPHKKLADMPSKISGVFGLFKSPDAIAAERVPILDAYLNRIFSIPDIFTSWEIQHFLGIDTHVEAISPAAQQNVEGMLYIKVVEARRLPLLESGKPINPYSKQYIVTPLHEPSQSSLSTDAYPESCDPRWYDEQLFCVRDRRRPMRFQLWDQHRVFADKLLGHIQFDMRPLADYSLYDIWLPLIGPNDEKNDPNQRSELHIMAQFTPMRIHKIINTRLPPFRLHLQKSEYYPGEIVRGYLVLNVGKPLSASQVFVRLQGTEETHWTESHTEHYTDSQGNRQTRTVTHNYGQTWPLIRESRLCWHRSLNQTQEPLLMSGSYVWPFEFLLPPRLPPTFKSQNGWVSYAISAEVDRPGVFTFNKRTQANIKILAPYTSLQPLPTVYGRLQKLPFRSANEVVYIEGHLDRPVCIIGDQHTLTLHIENRSAHRVTDAEITLRGQAIYRANGRTHMVNTEPFFARVKEPSFPVMPGEQRNVQIVFNVPPNTPPSLPSDLSPLIDLRYHIHVSCNMSGFLTGRARADIPVIISHPLPPPVWQLPPPPMYPTEQPDLNVIMEYGFGLPHFNPQYFSAFPSQSIPIQEDPNAQLGQAMFQAPPPPQSAFFINAAPANYPVGGQYVAPPTTFAQFSDSAPMPTDIRFGMAMDDTPAAVGFVPPQNGPTSPPMQPYGGAAVVTSSNSNAGNVSITMNMGPQVPSPQTPHYAPSQIVFSPDHFSHHAPRTPSPAPQGGAAVVTSVGPMSSGPQIVIAPDNFGAPHGGAVVTSMNMGVNNGGAAVVSMNMGPMGGGAVVTSMDSGAMGFNSGMQSPNMGGGAVVTSMDSGAMGFNGPNMGMQGPNMGGGAVVTSMDAGAMGFNGPNMQMQGSMNVTTSSSSTHTVNGQVVSSSAATSMYSTGYN